MNVTHPWVMTLWMRIAYVAGRGSVEIFGGRD